MKLNKRMLFGIISIALAAIIALIGIPTVLGQRDNSTAHIVRVKEAIAKGTVIHTEQVELVEVSRYGLPEAVAENADQVVGKYALVDLVVGDYFLPSKVSAEAPQKDTILSNLRGDKIALSMSVQSFAGMLSGKLRVDDIVTFYTYEHNRVTTPPELQYVRIIAVTNAGGTNIEDAVGDESRIAETITFLVNDRQAEKMVEIENSTRMHLALVSRGNLKRAKELLAAQEAVFDDGTDWDFSFTFGDSEEAA